MFKKFIKQILNIDSSNIIKNIKIYTSRYRKEKFCVDEPSLSKLKSEGIPHDILKKVNNLYNIDIQGKNKFKNEIKKTLGDDLKEKYLKLFLENCKKDRQLIDDSPSLDSYNKTNSYSYEILERNILADLNEIEEYLTCIQKKSNNNQLELRKKVLNLLSAKLPPIGLLQILNKEKGSTKNYIEKYENVLRNIYDQLKDGILNKRDKNEEDILRNELKILLKIWKNFSLKLNSNMNEELVKYILEDGDNDIYWLQYCIAHLSRDDLPKKMSKNFIDNIKEIANVTVDEINTSPSELENIERRTQKTLLNTQLSLLNTKEFAWSYLNLARLSLASRKENNTDLINLNYKEDSNDDDYITWSIEQALNTGAALTDIDRYIIAHSHSIKKNYHKVIEILEGNLKDFDENLLLKCNILLAYAYGKLWLLEDKKGEAEKSLEILFECSERTKLSDNELFLLCQILVGVKRYEDAKNIIPNIDFMFVEEDRITIAKLLWKLEGYSALNIYIQNVLEYESESIDFLSIYCGLLRTFNNRFDEADKIIKKIEVIDKTHPWILIRDCHKTLDQGNIKVGLDLYKKIPNNNGFWDQEKYLLECRLEVQQGNIEKANEFLDRVKAKDRIDYLYWRAIISANRQNYNDAYKYIESYSKEMIFENRFRELKARLLLANGNFEEALELFLQIKDNSEIKEYKAWCYLKTLRFEEAEKLVENEETENMLFIRALIYNAKEDDKNYYKKLKQFLEITNNGNVYLHYATEQFTDLLIKNEYMKDIIWFLENEKFKCYAKNDKLIQLYALEKQWYKVLELLENEGNKSTNNIICAYQNILSEVIKKREWKKAYKIIHKLEKYEEPTDDYKSYVIRTEFLDKLIKSDKKIDYNTVENQKDESIQVAIHLHKYINKKISFEVVFEKLKEWIAKIPEYPEPILLILILCMINNDKESTVVYAGKLSSIYNKIHSQELKMIAKILISMALEERIIDNQILLEIFTKFNDELPIKSEYFWNKLIVTIAQNNIYQAVDLIELVEDKNKINNEVKASIYANSALHNLNKNNIQLAIDNLEKAVEN